MYSGSYQDVVEVLQNEFGVTRADDSKPVLATYGIGPCVAVAGWSPEHKVGFLGHFSRPYSLGTLFYLTAEQLGGAPADFDARLIGGLYRESEVLIEHFKNCLREARPDLRMRLVEEDTGGTDALFLDRSARSIALDTRTGEVFSYDPKLNPGMRKTDDISTFIAIHNTGEARLAYRH